MARTMEAGPSVQPPGFLGTAGGRLLAAFACVVLILCGAIGSYFLARSSSDAELKSANLKIVELQNENQRLNADNNSRLVAIADLQSQIKSAQSKLAAIMPVENTYIISPNQSIVIAGGRLTLGLVGSPTNESVNININGKLQPATAGAVFNVALDPSTTCLVGVQSFDMFKAILAAWCSAVKPQ
jgi:hypothetical protein